MGDEYAECRKPHSHMGGKTDGCQKFRAVSLTSSPFKCDVCGCDRNYHRKVVYSKCNKIHDLNIPNSVDGCQRFIPVDHHRPNKPQRECDTCGCHKGFHQYEVTREVSTTSSGHQNEVTKEVSTTSSSHQNEVTKEVKKERI